MSALRTFLGTARLRLLAFFGAVFIATGLAYLPALRGGLLWDDDGHVTRRDLQSWHGLGRIWGELGATQQYYPVLHSAFWIEHRLWGDAPVGYHLVNLVFHAASACLFGLVLRRLWEIGPGGPAAAGAREDQRSVPGKFYLGTGGAWLAAVLFALHPVCVESVAWISEQKNTLSTVFYLLAAGAFLQFNEARSHLGASAARRSGPAAGTAATYAGATALFVLALLTKSVTATLPGALLVALWWRRGRLSWKGEVAPLLPWLLLGAGAGLLTAWVERSYIGAQGVAFDLSPLERCLLAGRAIWFYLGKLLWPKDLMFIYPHWRVSAAVGWQFGFPLAVVALLLLLRRRRGPLAALLFFIGTLFPALGFFNVYPFVFSYVADHFQYLASFGIFALAAAGWAAAAGAGGSRRFWAGTAAVGVLAALFLLTWRQSRTYRDVQTLYRATIARNPDCWMAHFNLGDALWHEGRLDEAISQFEDAVRIKPDYVEARNNLGGLLAHLGRLPEAIGQFEAAIRIRPFDARIHYNLGNALTDLGRLPEAIAQYEQTIRLKPDHAGAHYHLGLDLRTVGRTAEANAQLEEAARLQGARRQ